MKGKRSVRRNRLIADLLHRAGFIERVGSGFSRMEVALEENNNPPLQVVATNFFTIRFQKRLKNVDQSLLSARQLAIYKVICSANGISKQEISLQLTIGGDTVLRELKRLLELKLIKRLSAGRSTSYFCAEKE